MRRNKTNKMSVRPAKTQISLGIRPVWSESSLSAWRKLGSLATHWAHSKDSDQTGQMPRLIWVFAGHTLIFLFLSSCGSSAISLFSLIRVFDERMKKPWFLSYPLSAHWRLIRLGGCPGWSVFTKHTGHSVSFVMLWLKWTVLQQWNGQCF